jgi:hypothetical protein
MTVKRFKTVTFKGNCKNSIESKAASQRVNAREKIKPTKLKEIADNLWCG